MGPRLETDLGQQRRAARLAAAAAPAISSGTSTFSNAVSEGIRWKNWKTNPIFSPRSRASASSPRAVISTPSMTISPVVGTSSPAINPSNVDLPLPEGPTIERYCPDATERLTGRTMVSGSVPLMTVFDTLRSSIMRSAWTAGRRGYCVTGDRTRSPR